MSSVTELPDRAANRCAVTLASFSSADTGG
jgi:hypothetical protein